MDDFSLLDVLISMLWFFFSVAWIFLLVVLVLDIIRSRDLPGWGKALWVLFLVLLPVLTALIYLIVRGEGVAERRREDSSRREEWFRDYVRDVAGGSPSTADEIEKLAKLHDSGKLTDTEFETQKAKLLA